MKQWAWVILSFAAALASVRPACGAALNPTTITFGNVPGDIGNHGPITEGGYQYNALGASWSIETSYGDFTLANNALTTFWGQPPAVGNSITFSRQDGEPFFFDSVQIFGRLQGQPNDVLQAQGFRNGTPLGTLTLQSSLQAFTTLATRPAFAAPIDTLRLVQTQSNGSSLILDNLVFSQVPEPTSISLLAVGASALLLSRRHRA